jgi:hypothetical protein
MDLKNLRTNRTKGRPKQMKRALIVILGMLAASFCAFAQEPPVPTVSTGAAMALFNGKLATVQGAPYSGTITTESVQTLADGTRIVQTSTGTTARDSQGRTRQDTPLPAIGNLEAPQAPHLVFIQDPMAKVAYTLNLTDKTAQKMLMPPPLLPSVPGGANSATGGASGMMMSGPVGAISASGPVVLGVDSGVATSGAPVPPPPGGDAVYIQMRDGQVPAEPMPPPMVFQKTMIASDPSQVKTEDLGTQTMEGLLVTGTRTTRTIPAGQIGNDKPISIVREVWTSPDLKTIVSSKVSDPRMGEQTFQLTNVARTEPDPSLFSVPADFKVIDGPQKIIYRTNQ